MFARYDPVAGHPLVTSYCITTELAEGRINYIRETYGVSPSKVSERREIHYDLGGALWTGEPLAKMYHSNGLVLSCFVRDMPDLYPGRPLDKHGLVRLSGRWGMILMPVDVYREFSTNNKVRFYQRDPKSKKDVWCRVSKKKAEYDSNRGFGPWHPREKI